MKIIRFFPVLLMLAFMQHAYAETKIGAVNALRVLEQSPQAEAARKMIEKEFAPRDKRLGDQQRKVKNLEDKLNKDGAIMNEPARTKLEREIISQKRELKRTQDEFREDLNFRRNEEFTKVQEQIINAIQEVARYNSFDVILGEGVIYASDKVDISTMVIEHLKK